MSVSHASKLPPSAVNVAVADILAHLRTNVKDNDGDNIFRFPERQVTLGMGLGVTKPTSEDCPAIRLWYEGFTGKSDNEQFAIGRLFPCEISLYVYCHAEADSDPFQYRQALCEHIIRMLQEPDNKVTGAGGLMPRRGKAGVKAFVWSFHEDQTVVVDHTSVFRKIHGSIFIPPPLYGSRIDITLLCARDITADILAASEAT